VIEHLASARPWVQALIPAERKKRKEGRKESSCAAFSTPIWRWRFPEMWWKLSGCSGGCWPHRILYCSNYYCAAQSTKTLDYAFLLFPQGLWLFLLITLRWELHLNTMWKTQKNYLLTHHPVN
jgi:hypothetical protein